MKNLSVKSINNHLNKIEMLKEERQNNEVNCFNVCKLKLSSDPSEDELLETLQELKKYKINSLPYCEKQHVALELAIDECAITLDEYYSNSVDLSNIKFSYINSMYD